MKKIISGENEITLRLLAKDKLALFSLAIIVLFILMAIFAPYIAPYPEEGEGKPVPEQRFIPPSIEHPFGTDYLGRDILSRIIFGARISLSVGIFVVICAIFIGTPLGLIAGYYGGKVDEILMRATDVFLSFPSLLFAIALVASLGPGLFNAMLSLAITWWPWYTRLARAQAVSIKEQPFILASKAMGVSGIRIVFKHILPNSLTPIIVQGTMDMSSAILAEAGLSFIGLGAQAPSPEWGLMVSTGRIYLLNYWWFPVFPGLAIFLIALAFNLFGDCLRDILDPKTRKFRGITF
ncbi:MAG: ABC transporter permease [Nitrososphaeria archaeon]|nr:ABC transporter permease [Nitrososphaeria archaeon]